MRVVITRPRPDGEALGARLKSLGHQPVLAPLLDIRALAGVTLPARDWQAVLVTSANAVHAAGALGFVASLARAPAFAVGAASAQAAHTAGFGEVTAAAGDLASLAARVGQKADADKGPLLYLSGTTVSGDLKGLLESRGFSVERVALYEAVAAPALPPPAADGLRGGSVDAVVLYSPRTARIWAALTIAAGLGDEARKLRHFCLSDAVAGALEALKPEDGRIVVAARPDEAVLVEAINLV